MEFIFELLMELVFEGAIEGMKSKRVPMFLRVLLGCVVGMMFITIIGLFLCLGIRILNEHLVMGMVLIMLGIVLLILCLRKCLRFLKRQEGNDDFVK